MKLEDTVSLMTSNDWKDRFVAEYNQLCIRLFKLKDVIDNPPAFLTDEIERALLMKQFDAMEAYKLCLEKRAVIANIDLNPHHY